MAYNTFNDEAIAWLIDKIKTNTSAIAAIQEGGAGEKYDTGTATTAGITKLYNTTGSNTDGTMTQAAITSLLGDVESLLANI